MQEEPERHVWQGEVGTAAQPWLGDHQIRNVAVLPGAAYCEMALGAARAVLGEAAEVRDIHFEQALLLDEQTTVGVSAMVASPGVVDFTVETNHGDEQARQATAVLNSAEDEQPPAYDTSALLAAHPRREDGAESRKRLDQHGVQYGPAFAGLGVVHTGEGETGTVLAEVALPREIRSQQDAYGVHPALLDACFQSVAAHPDVQALGGDVLALPLGIRRLRSYGAARNAHYCYTRVTKADIAEIEADLELLDEHGTVLLAVQGLRLGRGASEENHKDRTLGERLLTIEWRQGQLPELPHADAGTWLLISATATDVVTTALTDALKNHGAQCTTMCWPQQADFTANAEELRNHLRPGGFSGVVILTGPKNGDAEDQSPLLGRECVQHLVHITRELPEIPSGSPRLYVVTRNARTVAAADVANLEQAGLRGLMRVIGAEHPHLRAAQIDLDEATDAEQLAQQLLSGSEEDETAWRNGQWYTARLRPAPLHPEERQITVADHERDGMRLQIRTPGDLKTLELVACDRIPPGPGQIEVAISASSINFAEVLVAFGRYHAFEGRQQQLGTDFAGVVTAVGHGVTDHHVGDHVGGVADGCWRTFITCEANLAVKLPAGLSDGQAAAVTTAHATAWYGLHDLAKIESGE
ncbi:MAG TPA: polyketide synthase dehydratase domain-containing protein, partial [Kribbella sp.]